MYANANPMSFVDPSGNMTLVEGMVVTALVMIIVPLAWDITLECNEPRLIEKSAIAITEKELTEIWQGNSASMYGGYNAFAVGDSGSFPIEITRIPNFWLIWTWGRDNINATATWIVDGLNPAQVTVTFFWGKDYSFTYHSSVVESGSIK
jgi:hypothetical protein